jgi:hypothetical protein
MKLLVLALCVGAIGCADIAGPLPREGPPDEFELSIGGFGTASRNYEVRGDTLVYTLLPWSGGPGEATIVTRRLSDTEWAAFWDAARQAGLRRWRSRYVAEGVVDGTGWSLRLRAGDTRIESTGSNAYPDRLGAERELDMPPEFRQLLSVLDSLLGLPVLVS